MLLVRYLLKVPFSRIFLPFLSFHLQLPVFACLTFSLFQLLFPYYNSQHPRSSDDPLTLEFEGPSSRRTLGLALHDQQSTVKCCPVASKNRSYKASSLFKATWMTHSDGSRVSHHRDLCCHINQSYEEVHVKNYGLQETS